MAYSRYMPIHLRAENGDYASAVLCPGDPRRAKYIAETFFDPGARCVNEERGMLGYTGTYKGKPISVQSTGMGTPSAGIVFEELVMLGATRLIRVGTCGGLQTHLQMADTVIAVSASADDRTPIRYAGMEGYAPTAAFSLVETAARLSREVSKRVFVGSVVTSGLFYDPDTTSFDRWRSLQHLGVEMEASMLYTIAAIKGVDALAMMTVSDVLAPDASPVRITDDDLKKGVDQMMRIACDVAIS